MKSNEIYEEVTGKIVSALKDGVIPWEREFTVEGGVHRSFSTHKPYRGGNQFYLDLIAQSQGYKSPFWITFNQIKKREGKLIKINKADEKGTGQKSSIIFFFKMFQSKDKNGKLEFDPKTGKPIMIPYLKADRVFNLDQVEGIEAPELEASKYTPEERAASVIDGMPNPPKYSYDANLTGIARYDSGLDLVTINHKDHARVRRETFRGLVLSTTHSKRLSRKPEYGDDPEFSKERLIGEMGAAMLVGLTGLKVPPSEVKQRKLDGWIAALEEKPRLVVQAASKAQGACDYIVPAKDDDDEA
jgi:antirestriction protein ArdC